MARNLQTKTKSLTNLQWWLFGGLVVFSLGFYLLVYRPAEGRALALRASYNDQWAELAASRNRAKDLPRISAENEDLSLRLAKSKRLPKQAEWADLVRDITRLSNQSSLKKFSYKYGLAKRNDTFSQLPIVLDFEGDLMDVHAFVRQIEELSRMTRLRSITLKSNDKSGHVQVQMALNTYFSTESQ